MRVEVDRVLCEANGLCEQLAPELFRLDDDDQLEILEPTLSAEHVDAARLAVDQCPRAALSIED